MRRVEPTDLCVRRQPGRGQGWNEKSGALRQLTFVFADSPEGGKGSRKRDESRGRPYLLHIAKAMTATSSTTTE